MTKRKAGKLAQKRADKEERDVFLYNMPNGKYATCLYIHTFFMLGVFIKKYTPQ